jgi:hypothetical protein
MTDNQENKEYKVGYKKPPREHQFKPGQSGCPKGRPRLIQDFNTDFQDELEEVIKIQEGGKLKPITKQRALIKRLITNALGGNASSIKIVTAILSKMPFKVEDIEQDLSTEDAKILQQFIERKINHE